MIIIGDISGIQSYLFDVAEEGGGQAQRLRARSFIIQLAAEAAALRILRTVGWPTDESHFMFSAAGKFVLQGPESERAAERVAAAWDRITDWLLRETRGELRLAVGCADGTGVDTYRLAQRELQRAKTRPWVPAEGTSGGWDLSRLVLPPLGTPCPLCRHAPAEVEETDPDGKGRKVCRWCAFDRSLGRRLPRARWLVLREAPGDFEMFGYGVTVPDAERVSVGADVVAVANLRTPEDPPARCPPEKFLRRRLMAYIPNTEGRPIEFKDLARKASGDHLLGVLKADADSLGRVIDAVLRANTDLRPFAAFSKQLEAFFAADLKAEIESGRDPRWRWIYTIFAGGDDLIMVGPWDVMLDFAGRLYELFRATFGGRGLTISAGLALCKPMRPIKGVVAEADRLLEQAKAEPKDQLACFGQVWKWKDHAIIMGDARRLVGWVDAGQMKRGWLHTLLGLVEVRHPARRDSTGTDPRPDYLATARLAHHVERNYYRKTAARDWAEGLIKDFDDPNHVKIRYLPAILRYALTATRVPGDKE